MLFITEIHHLNTVAGYFVLLTDGPSTLVISQKERTSLLVVRFICLVRFFYNLAFKLRRGTKRKKNKKTKVGFYIASSRDPVPLDGKEYNADLLLLEETTDTLSSSTTILLLLRTQLRVSPFHLIFSRLSQNPVLFISSFKDEDHLRSRFQYPNQYKTGFLYLSRSFHTCLVRNQTNGGLVKREIFGLWKFKSLR